MGNPPPTSVRLASHSVSIWRISAEEKPLPPRVPWIMTLNSHEVDHGAKQPRKRALRLAGFGEKFNHDDASTGGQDAQTLPQDLAADLLGLIVQNVAEKDGIIRTTERHRA
jgi:hypothetical protein